jgi:DNA ligase D-like protein (predicted ligase)
MTSPKKNLFTDLSPALLKKRKKVRQPEFVPPMLATLTKDYFSNKEWLYEHKFDGERCLAIKKNGHVHLLSRNRHSMNDIYPELVTALEKQRADNFIIDGEIISRNKSGISDFQQLQQRINIKNRAEIKKREKKFPVIYCIFDLMYADGYDLRDLPLLVRKQILKKLLTYNAILTYTDHKVGTGLPFFKYACKHHWEGLIAKRINSVYEEKRSRAWLKFKCIMKQELVIGGYTEPKGSRTYFGALLVGYYEKGSLKFAGKVGTGYSAETLAMLGKKLRRLASKKCPFINYDESSKNVHWVKPTLVAEFQFAQWTKDDKLRVGRYKGLRDDKAARDVVQEIPKAIGPEQ